MSSWLILTGIVVSICLSFLKYKFQYWQRKGVKTGPLNAYIGNWLQLKTMHHTAILEDLYQRFKATESLVGFYIYTKPVAVILDLDLIKSVMIKDFNAFMDRLVYKNDEDLLTANLFFWESAKWRPVRQKLITTFKPSKIKYMFPTINIVAAQLRDTCDEYLKTESDLNISDLIARFTIDNICNCILGIGCNSLQDPHNECHRIAAKITGTANTNVKWQLFMQTYVNMIPFIAGNVKVYPKLVEDFFIHFLMDNFKERERLGIRRNDLVDLLIDLKNRTDDGDNPGISYNEIASQLFIFFLGGFETSASAISFALYELARHPDIQQKVRQEILKTLKEHNNEFSYEASKEMPYLQQIISETIRSYPILTYLERAATKDYRIPNTNVVLDKGTTVYIPIRSINYDPEIYEQPEEFCPERFHLSEVAKRHPMSFLGFGDGPRNCIGQRLGRIQVLVGLVSLLSNYKFSVCDKTVENIEYSKHIFTTKSLDDIWLRVDKFEDI